MEFTKEYMFLLLTSPLQHKEVINKLPAEQLAVLTAGANIITIQGKVSFYKKNPSIWWKTRGELWYKQRINDLKNLIDDFFMDNKKN